LKLDASVQNFPQYLTVSEIITKYGLENVVQHKIPSAEMFAVN